MTSPKLAFPLRGRGRCYPWPPQDVSNLPLNQWKSVNPENLPDGLTPLPSVTNVLSIVDKPALKGWAAEQAIRALYDSGIFPDTADKAVEAHKYAFNRVSKERADAGTRAHTIAERLTQDLPLPADISEEDEAFADAYLRFWADWSPEPLHVEATVLNPDVGYGGTGDLFAVIDGKVAVLDWKTRGAIPDEKKRKKFGLLYDETKMQLAALAHAPYLARQSPDGWSCVDTPDCIEAWGVVLYPNGEYDYEVLSLPSMEDWFDCFQGVLRAWRVLKGAPKGVAA